MKGLRLTSKGEAVVGILFVLLVIGLMAVAGAIEAGTIGPGSK